MTTDHSSFYIIHVIMYCLLLRRKMFYTDLVVVI